MEDFTHIGVKHKTKRQIAILAKVLNRKIFVLIEIWANDAWEMAKKAGLVTDAMLEPDAHWMGVNETRTEEPGKGKGNK